MHFLLSTVLHETEDFKQRTKTNLVFRELAKMIDFGGKSPLAFV